MKTYHFKTRGYFHSFIIQSSDCGGFNISFGREEKTRDMTVSTDVPDNHVAILCMYSDGDIREIFDVSEWLNLKPGKYWLEVQDKELPSTDLSKTTVDRFSFTVE